VDWETWAAKGHQDGGNYFFCGKIAKPVTSRENTLLISVWQVFKFQRIKARLAKQRRLLSDWSVQSGISCEFIRIAGRRLPASWHIDGWISSFKFHVCWCDHDTEWKLLVLWLLWSLYLFYVKNYFMWKKWVFGFTKRGRCAAKCPFLASSFTEEEACTGNLYI